MFCASLDVLDDKRNVDPQYSFSDLIRNNEKLQKEEEIEKHRKWQEELLDELEQNMDQTQMENMDENWKKMKDTDPLMKRYFYNRERISHENPDVSSRLFYGEMPEEAVCTENLTPWSKLLPCRAESGLGQLLHSLFLYNTLYHSLGITIRYSLPSSCSSVESCDSVRLEIIQTLGVVFKTESMDVINIASLFGESVLSSCSLANGNSFVYLQLPSDASSLSSAISISPSPDNSLHSLPFYRLSKENLSLILKYKNRNQALNLLQEFSKFKNNNPILSFLSFLFISFVFVAPASPVLFSRSSLGKGDENGGIMSQIINPTNDELHLLYFEYLPWNFPIYFHSLRIYLNGELIPLTQGKNVKLFIYSLQFLIINSYFNSG